MIKTMQPLMNADKNTRLFFHQRSSAVSKIFRLDSQKRNPAVAGVPNRRLMPVSGVDDDLGRLHAFRSLLGLETPRLPFGQGFESTALDDGVMYKHIFTAVL